MQQHVYSLAAACSLLGVKHVVMSPGSRSAPLVFAFARNKKFVLHTFIDERSAAYAALGIAQQTQKPVLLFCTSGTAAANYYPAVTEAFYQQVPLVVVTADRPPELLHQQDGQMIDQQNLFGTHARAFYQLPCYKPGQEDHRHTATTVAAAVKAASGPVKGPVHINMPFTEPLYPHQTGQKPDLTESEIAGWIGKPVRKERIVPENDLAELERAWIGSGKKLLLLGQGAMHERWITPLLQLQAQHDIVIAADVVSNKHLFNTIAHFDALLGVSSPENLRQLEPDLLISMGGPMLSKSLKNWLKTIRPGHHFRIHAQPETIDTYGNVTRTISVNPRLALERLASIEWNEHPGTGYADAWKRQGANLERKLTRFLGQPVWSELHATRIILDRLPVGTNLQLANSSVVRYVSLCGNADPGIIVNSNRGTSGIDGCTSTAVGAALVNLRPTVLLTGDLAFLYDRNGLWTGELPDNLRIIVFNNHGGGIFTLIDGPGKHPAYKKYFTTPVTGQVKIQAQQTGLDYYFCSSPDALKRTLPAFFNPLNKASLLELDFDMDKNAAVFRQFKNIKP